MRKERREIIKITVLENSGLDPKETRFEIAEKLEAAGKEYIYPRLPGVTHNAWDYTYKAELIDWILSKRK